MAIGDFDKAAYWFDGVESDFQTARAMLETRQLLYGFNVTRRLRHR